METIFKNKRLVFFFLLAIMLIHCPLLKSQVNSTDSALQKQFDSFYQKIHQDYGNFRKENDSIFLKFLDSSWKEFTAIRNQIPARPKPVNPPVYISPEQSEPKSDTVSPGKMGKENKEPESDLKNPDAVNDSVNEELKLNNEEKSFEKYQNPAPEPEAISKTSSTAEIDFYGTNFTILQPGPGLPVLASVTKESIAGYFSAASASDLLNNAAVTLKSEAAGRRLNDWGLANLMMKAAQQMYPQHNEQVMFTWFALLRAGFNVKLGYDKQNVFLLLPSDEILYETSYTVNGRPYYYLNFGPGQPQPETLRIHQADYPQSVDGLSFKISQTPEFLDMNTKKSISSSPVLDMNLNKNLIDFYSSYPQCELKVVFSAPLSGKTQQQLDAFFIPVLKGKTDDERVAYLLEFVQKSIRYQTDGQQFGYEKYLFADETLYYPAADCEDRAVFLAKLIERYTWCKVIGLSYPNHVSLAVNLKTNPGGKYIEHQNLKYYHCDPTYIGATCGICMPEFQNITPEIIEF